MTQADGQGGFDIAIVGMAGRFPRARTLAELWERLRNGEECISRFSDEELLAAGADPAEIADPHYVPAGGVLPDAELFDAQLFGFYPREAEILDPQQRVLLELAWEALERAGYDPSTYGGLIGVYAGAGMNSYLVYNLLANRDVRESVHPYQLTLANDKDFLATRISYKLDLRGPSVTVQTACSSSLMAVHLACQSLVGFQCDMALAGGVTIRVPQGQGYRYQEGGIASPDGHCRAFDAKANGTVGSNGAGLVVLKRLADAMADGDHVHAVIKATAANNDGAMKVGYTAPSIDGQADVIATAQALAQVDPRTIGYVEAHGTGTALGDPIEIAALTQAFRAGTDATGFCAIGSLKTNLGHLDAAAGVASLIKTALALEHRELPPSLHFEAPNPEIDFARSPFVVNAALAPWPAPPGGTPRRAGVSSFGMGGTNVHAVLEEAPAATPPAVPARRPWQLVLVSARTTSALETASADLARHLRAHPDLPLADVAYTTQVGRRRLEHHRVVVARDAADAASALERPDPKRTHTGRAESGPRPVAFLFTGQGAQHVTMGAELYEREVVFRRAVDRCAEALRPHLGVDLRRILYPRSDAETEEAGRRIDQTAITQPALFTVEYALAELWRSWGVQPDAMLGHSIGEYVAATLAGVFRLEDALTLVAERGRLMQGLPAGSMLSVPLGEDELRPLLGPDVALAAINGSALCVASGSADAIGALEARLAQGRVEGARLRTSHAFHSAMMEPILAEFEARVAGVARSAPRIPFVSNVTGGWIRDAEATDPRYWVRHLRETVRFYDGIGTLLKGSRRALIEIGPGRTLATLAGMHPEAEERVIVPAMRHPRDQQSDVATVLLALGRVAAAGSPVSWNGLHGDDRRRRLPLPSYPFERQRYWIEPSDAPAPEAPRAAARERDPAPWLVLPSWRRANAAPLTPAGEAARYLVFADETVGPVLVERLRAAGHRVVSVVRGERFERVAGGFTIDPASPTHYGAILDELEASDELPQRIVHCWSLLAEGAPSFASDLAAGYESLLALGRAMAEQVPAATIALDVVTAEVHEVTGREEPRPAAVTVMGPALVIPMEQPGVTVRCVDLERDALAAPGASPAVRRLTEEVQAEVTDRLVALRGRHRWVQAFEPAAPGSGALELRSKGTYLVTGGLGRVGLVLAETIAEETGGNLILLGRSRFPARSEWDAHAAEHGGGAIARIIARIRAMEAKGARVLVEQGDVADRDALRQAVTRAEMTFGALHGVVHAAGLVGEETIRSVPETGPAETAAQFRAKVQGTMALEEVLRERSLDFCLLVSSLAATLGGLGFSAYAAANRFQGAFAQRMARADGRTRWVSVEWDGWSFGDEPEVAGRGDALAFALAPAEGAAAFRRLLEVGAHPIVLVATGDPEVRLAQWAPPPGAAADEPASEAPRHPRPELPTAFEAPRTELERTIVRLWERVLGIGPIGVHDDFFALGGHSLLATQLVSRLRDTYRVELPLRRVFEAATVAGIAESIAAAGGADGEALPGAAAIRSVPRDKVLPLSFGQQRLWFLDQFEPGSPLYNNPAMVRLRGRLDVGALERSLNRILRRHEILRTAFTAEGGRPVQTVLPDLTLPVPLVDLRHVPVEDHEAEVARRAQAEAIAPFDLSRPPLLRVTLLRLEDEEHVVLLTMHHIVSDGWSVQVMVQEMAVLYAAFVRGAPAPLPALPVQYADFAHWQRGWLQGEVLETQLGYWRRQLAGLPAMLELPIARPRPPVQTFRGANVEFDISPDLARRLSALAKAEDATPFMVLLAAFQTLLHRYTGQGDIPVGTPIANRNRAETEGLIGFFVNTLVLRADFADDPSFRALIRQVRETAMEAYAHQDLPFETLVEALAPERDLSHTPLFQIMFNLQIATDATHDLAGLTLTPSPVDSGTAKFDITLFMEERGGGLHGLVNFNTDLFDADAIVRMMAHFRVLLDDLATDPDRPVSELALVPAEERRLLLEQWPGTHRDMGAEVHGIHERIQTQVSYTPDAVAVVGEGSDGETVRLTYRELNRRANQVAHRLRALDVAPGVSVGLGCVRTPDMIVGLLGILKAGGVYLPLDPALPTERLRYMLEDARARIVLTTAGLAPRFPDDATRLCLDADAESLAGELDTDPTGGAGVDDPAYIIYTSGSTGLPKGVRVSHRALANHLRTIRAHYQLGPSDRVLQFASLSFDASLEQILPALAVGARLVLRGDEVPSPAAFDRMVVDGGLTVVNVPPAFWRQWVREAARVEEPDYGHLRLVIVGGDAMPADEVATWFASPLGGVRLLNAYGPTETTITATTCQVEPADAVGGLVPIGRPLPNRRAYVLDRRGEPVPIGVLGELYLGGDGLAEGYLNRPEVTEERFVPDPFGEPGERLYRTGDLARYLPDGRLAFAGRADQQVKVRGFRIELGEIETALSEHPAVREAAVAALDRGRDDVRLVAYVVGRGNGHATTGEELRAFLGTRLPDYMVPPLFVPLETLPRTAGGKVDRRALPAPDADAVSARADYVAPRSEVEEELARLWGEVLGVERVGIHDGFFALGGHSLLATQLVSRVRDAFGVELPLRRLFETPTVAALGVLIAQELAAGEDEAELAGLLDEIQGLGSGGTPGPDDRGSGSSS